MSVPVSMPLPAPGVRTARCADEVVLLDPASARLHVLDAAAALVWHCFDGETSTDEIVTDVADVFTRDVDDVRAYVDDLVALLAARDLVVDGRVRVSGVRDDGGARRPRDATVPAG